MMFKKIFLNLALVCVGANAFAYDATQGALQNDPGLAGYGYGVNSGYSQQPRVIYKKDRWGAFSVGIDKYYIAHVTNQDSKEIASQKALKKCERKSGGRCSVNAVYSNGCAALAVFASESNHGIYRAGWGKNKRDAEMDTLAVCQKDSGGRPCYIVQSAKCTN